MFIRAEFKLSGPICGCSQQDLMWSVFDHHDGHGLLVICKLYGTELCVPHAEFKARLVLDESYPQGFAKEKPKARKERRGKVIELFPVKKDT